MTRVRIPQPDTEEDVSAEQVAAYLLRPGSGWREIQREGGYRCFRFGRKQSGVAVARRADRRMMSSMVLAIARAEQRHPSAVLADIVGPARAASVGARCGPRPVWCRACAGGNATMSKADTADERSAAHGAGESEEPSQ